MQGYFSLFVFLTDIHAVYSAFGHRQQIYRTKDSRIRQMSPPVPSEHAVCFADMHKAIHRIFTSVCRLFFVSFFNILQRRMEIHTQDIFSCFHLSCYIKLPGSVHVICITDFFFIQIDITDRIQTFKAKPLSLAFLCFGSLKHGLILIIFFHQIQCSVFIVLPERIFHLSVSQQICIHSSRNLRRIPLCIACSMHLPYRCKLLFFRCKTLHIIASIFVFRSCFYSYFTISVYHEVPVLSIAKVIFLCSHVLQIFHMKSTKKEAFSGFHFQG